MGLWERMAVMPAGPLLVSTKGRTRMLVLKGWLVGGKLGTVEGKPELVGLLEADGGNVTVDAEADTGEDAVRMTERGAGAVSGEDDAYEATTCGACFV